jgi:hypothetical protein
MAEEEKEDKSSERWEILFGVVLAIFAAVLAICDLGAGKYGDDEILAANEKAGAYLWYQSKGIKQTLVEGQANFMTTMIETGSVDKSKVASVEAEVAKLRTKVERYEKEKTEILEGSEKVGKENWVQEVDGKLGQVPGAKEFDRVARELGKVGDVFDQGTLYLQMCLVMGAIGIISRQEGMKRVFFAFLLVLGLLGSYYTWIAYQQAGKI